MIAMLERLRLVHAEGPSSSTIALLVHTRDRAGSHPLLRVHVVQH